MCLNPTLIPNPNIRSKTAKGFKKDTVSQFIPVPCGHCPECIATRSLGIIQRCELEEMTGHPFMITLTYSNDMIPVYELSDGTKIKYADFNDVTRMFKRLRKSNAIGRPFRYLCVSERGKKGRPHFHLLLYVQKLDSDHSYIIMNLEQKVRDSVLFEWRRNVSKSTKFPEFKPLCQFVERHVFGKIISSYDCHYVQSTSSDGSTVGASHYVTKYFLKRDEATQKLQQALKLSLPSFEYEKVWNKVRTRCIQSLNFGFGLYGSYNPKTVNRVKRLQILSELPTFKHVQDSLSRSVIYQDSPKYYYQYNGQSIPLSRYFYHIPNLYTLTIYNHFKDKNNTYGDFVQIDDRSIHDRLSLMDIKSKKLSQAFKFNDITDLI